MDFLLVPKKWVESRAWAIRQKAAAIVAKEPIGAEANLIKGLPLSGGSQNRAVLRTAANLTRPLPVELQ